MPPKKDEEKKMQAPSVPATAPNQTKATKKKRKRRSRKGAANKSVKTKIIEETLSSIGDVDAETSSVLANAGKWDSLSLPPPLLRVLTDVLGFTEMTTVQAKTIPLFMGNKDVIVKSSTGSGKTLCFLVPLFARLCVRPPPPHALFALVIAPTRELAVQTHAVAAVFATEMHLQKPLLLIGGTSKDDDRRDFAQSGCNVTIGTPGRIAEFLISNNVDTSAFNLLILDEGDKLLELGFQAQMTQIISRLPKQRRTGVFSATGTEAFGVTRNPFHVDVESTINDRLDNRYCIIPNEKKLSVLYHFLTHHEGKAIVYFLTCDEVKYCTELFRVLLPTLTLFSIHGRASLSIRRKNISNFSKSTNGVLFATDVAARGLDLPEVEWVFQELSPPRADAPQSPTQYVHRVGRTARMGRHGHAVALLYPNEGALTAYVEEVFGLNLTPSELPQLSFDAESAVRSLCLKEREHFERSQAAFVSYLRGYKEHQLKYIFSLDALNIGKTATGFGLIALPQMGEMKKRHFDFVTVSQRTDLIPYKDEKREKERLEKKRKEKEMGRDKHKEYKEKFKKAMKRRQENRSSSFSQNEIDELFAEERMFKRMKKGKISQKEFDKMFGENF